VKGLVKAISSIFESTIWICEDYPKDKKILLNVLEKDGFE
jgi:hypothetical protein